jgi:hypothetical protein
MVSGGLTRITKMKYKAIIYKTTGVCISNAFPLLRNAELYASHNSDPGDRVSIQEHSDDEQNTLYEYEA